MTLKNSSYPTHFPENWQTTGGNRDMPDTKLSALPVATAVANADLLYVASGGNSKSSSRSKLLTAAPGDGIIISGAGGGFIQIDAAGNIQLFPGTLAQNSMQGFNGSFVTIDSTGNIFIVPAPGAFLQAAYSPAAPANWIGSPASLSDAIDRIAAVVSNGGLNPIP